MAKILLMDKCYMCFYSCLTTDGWMCWHSESEAFNNERMQPIDPIPDWCPLEDAEERDRQVCIDSLCKKDDE